MKPKLPYRARKSLGQNFLKSKSAIADIISAANLKKGEAVLEIGPGKGVLTEALLSAGTKVLAVEKDNELFEFLRDKFSVEIKSGRLELVLGDILNLQSTTYNLQSGSYKLVANIPYNITGEILRKFIGGDIKPSRAVLLVQKEVAERIVARDGKESVLSISVKVYGRPKFIKKVQAKYFSPPPKVDSAILLIENIKTAFAGDSEQMLFFEIVKTGFAHKRKLLSGNLSGKFGRKKVEDAFASCGIVRKSRAEDLGLKNWICLCKTLGR